MTMTGVMIVPTGIGAAIGGHSGDANPAAKLVASVCDRLITHPNVVNAADINEMTDNTLYVEGSILDRFLEGDIELQEVMSNKILVVTNLPLRSETVNAVSAARATVGIEAEVLVLDTPLEMVARLEEGGATGEVTGWKEMVETVQDLEFDALAIHTPIKVDRGLTIDYYTKGGINPWGGVEAKASKLIATALEKPVAHAPLDVTPPDDRELYNILDRAVDPRQAPEAVTVSCLHSVLRGLWRAPRIGKGISVDDVDFLLTPVGCVGRPHRACLERGIPVIAVEENTTCLDDEMPDVFTIVGSYMEAVGMIQAMRIGISPESVSRPLYHTKVDVPRTSD